MTTRPNVSVATSPHEPIASADVGSLWSGKRLYIAGLLFLNFFINFMHRINLSVAAPAIAKEFRWDAGKMGHLFSSYQWTYCVFLLHWGWMTDRMNTRLVNALSVTIWSIAGMLTGVATTLGGMLTTRLALAAGEAASFPTAGKVVRQWFPASERGLATAIFNAGTFAGPAFSAPMVAWLLSRVGWRFSFTLTGALGFVWVLLWVKFFRVRRNVHGFRKKSVITFCLNPTRERGLSRPWAHCSVLWPARLCGACSSHRVAARISCCCFCFGCLLTWCNRAICRC
jgi:ACS family glucarate transporter-like MFS transporter